MPTAPSDTLADRTPDDRFETIGFETIGVHQPVMTGKSRFQLGG
jgi:hypothetical protein